MSDQPDLLDEIAELERIVSAQRARLAKFQAALLHIQVMSECQCTVDWTGRGRHAPACQREIYLTASEALTKKEIT